MSKFNKINIYYRQTAHNKISPTRVPWFDYEKSFKNLLDTISWPLCNLTVCFDGSQLEYESHFTKKYQEIYGFRVVLIDTKSYNGPSYEKDGSSKSSCLVSKIVRDDGLPEDSLIFWCENDYIYRVGWPEVSLDLFNNYISDNHYISLYDHLDKYIFTKSEATDHWGMYKDLKSKIILSSYCHWRYVPNICSSWIFPQRLFDRDYDLLSLGISDNTGCNEFNKRDGTQFLTPITSLATHSETWFLAPYINWQKILEETKIL
jgi:hypothetical protein